MWIQQPLLHRVAVPTGSALAIPPDRCCNCGGTDCVAPEAVTLRRTIYIVIGGFEQRLKVALPACASCKRTMYRPAPGLPTRVFYAGITSFLGLLGLMALLMKLDVKPSLGLGGIWAICAAVSLMVTGAYYATRRPRGSQTSYYQPVRLLGGFSVKQADKRRSYTVVGFTHPDVAAATADATPGAELRGAAPSARALRP